MKVNIDTLVASPPNKKIMYPPMLDFILPSTQGNIAALKAAIVDDPYTGHINVFLKRITLFLVTKKTLKI